MSAASPTAARPSGRTPSTEARLLGNRIRVWRIEAGLKQEELAPLVGASRPLVSKWETGKSMPDAIQIRCLARVLQRSYADLLGSLDGDGTLPAKGDRPLLTSIPGGRRATDPARRSLPFLTLVD